MRTVFYYSVTAAAWILLSDWLVRLFTVDPNMLTILAIGKGIMFVVVTSGLLFFQIRSDLGHVQESGDRLRESEQRFRAVIDVSPVPMAMYSADGVVTLANRAFVSLLGYTPEDLPTVDAWWTVAYPDAEYRKVIRDRWNAELERSRVTGEPFNPIEARIRCKDGGDRTMIASASPVSSDPTELVVVFYDITERVQAEEVVLGTNARLEDVLRSVTSLIGKVVEARDPYTKGHEEGVARISCLIAEEMGLPPKEVEGIEVAALVHDVGKLSVPAEILTKPGQLTNLEFQLIKGHSDSGYEILKEIDFDWPVAETVRQHHERMDGSGYPAGLRGDDIALASRILMAADVIEAMAAHRPYRSALGLDAAMAELTDHPDKYDAQVVEACQRLYAAGRITV